ncbi:MAG TPA: cobalamin-binding protein [Usitatibacter sp.]|nr:cobalamin-binding protein [Usitatibacter sp.]
MLKQPAERIVTLAPALTELAFTVGAGPRVVAASAYSDYPPEARALPRVADAAGFSIESIAALHPDLALVWADSMRIEDVDRIEAFGTAVYVVRERNFEDVTRALRAIGTLTGTDAGPAVQAFESRLEALRARYAARPRVSAFLEIWHSPLTTIAGRHFMNEALAICGAANVFSDLPGVAPVVSWEEVFRRDPDVIVGIGSAPTEADFHSQWSDRAALRAVASGHLVFADADRLQRLTARTPDGVASLCAALDRVRPAIPAR